MERARRAADPQLLLPADPQLLLGTTDPLLLIATADPLLGAGVDPYRRCEDRVEQHCFKNPVIKPSTETIKSCKVIEGEKAYLIWLQEESRFLNP